MSLNDVLLRQRWRLLLPLAHMSSSSPSRWTQILIEAPAIASHVRAGARV